MYIRTSSLHFPLLPHRLTAMKQASDAIIARSHSIYQLSQVQLHTKIDHPHGQYHCLDDMWSLHVTDIMALGQLV